MRILGFFAGLFYSTLLFAVSASPITLIPVPDFLYPTMQKMSAEARKAKLPTPEDTPAQLPMMSLRDAILLALRNNPSVRNAELTRVNDKFSLAVAYNAFAPQFSFENATATYEPGAEPSYSLAPEVAITTPMGTQLSTTFNGNYDGGANTSTTFSVTQPLLQGFGSDVNLASLRTAQYQEKVNRLNLKSTLISVITQVINGYYALVQAYNNFDVLKIQLKDAEEELNQTKLKIKVGQSAASEAVSQEASIAQQKLDLVGQANSIEDNAQALLLLLGLNPHVHLTVNQKIDYDTLKIPDVDQSVKIGLANSITYQSDLMSLKINELAVLTAKDALKPTLNVIASETQQIENSGSFAITGGSTSLVGGGGGGSNRSIQLNLTVPLSQLSLHQALVQAQIALQQERITMEQDRQSLISTVISDIRNLQTQKQQIKLADENVKLQQLNYNNDRLSYAYGKISSFQLTTDQQNLISAQQGLISQEISYITSYAGFEQDIGTTLDRWKILVKY